MKPAIVLLVAVLSPPTLAPAQSQGIPTAVTTGAVGSAGYGATIAVRDKNLTIKEGEPATLTVTVTNKGSVTWLMAGANPIALSWHILDAQGEVVTYDNPRTSITSDVQPGESLQLSVEIPSDRFVIPGKYQLELDMVHEGVTWFEEQGSPTVILPTTVE